MSDDNPNPTLLINILETATIGAVVMILFSGAVWGAGAVAILMGHVSCFTGAVP